MLSPRKFKFLDNFKLSADGKYIYTGDVYSLKGDWKKSYIKMSLLCFFAAASVVGSGFINAAGMNNSFYVIVPYVGEVICLFAVLWSSVRIVYAGSRVRAYVYEPGVSRLTAGSLALGVFSLIALVGSVVFTALHGFEGKMLQCIIYWVLKLSSSALGIAVNRFVGKLEWEKL